MNFAHLLCLCFQHLKATGVSINVLQIERRNEFKMRTIIMANILVLMHFELISNHFFYFPQFNSITLLVRNEEKIYLSSSGNCLNEITFRNLQKWSYSHQLSYFLLLCCSIKAIMSRLQVINFKIFAINSTNLLKT